MSRRWHLIFMVSALIAPTVASQSAIITKCGSSKGYAYYFGGQAVPPGKAGWQEDGISGGEFQLIQDGKALDIVFTDPRGTKSRKGQGFQVFSVPQREPGFMLVVAIHSRGVVEHYLYQLDTLGNGSVVWGSLKGGGWPIQKSAIYKATCRSP